MEDPEKPDQKIEKPPILTARQVAVVDALATGLPITKASSVTGVSRRSIHYWLKDGAFRDAIARRQQELRERVADEMTDLALISAATLKEYLSEEGGGSMQPARVKTAIELLRVTGFAGAPKGDRSSKADPPSYR